jgi:DNA polymerase III alpha subunit
MSSTKLKDRELRYDGVSIVQAADVPKFFLRGLEPADLRVPVPDADVQIFNEQLPYEQLLDGLNDPLTLRFSWKLPQEYMELDVRAKLWALFERQHPPYDLGLARTRLETELLEFERRGLFDLLRAIMYVLDVFMEKNVVWGVGRGSSCASYVLFLLGLHVVDPILHDVDLEEFMH